MTIYLVMTLQMVYLRNVTNKINLTELMINPETIEFMGINILFLFPLFFSFNPKKKKIKKSKKKRKKKKIKMQTRTFTIAFFFDDDTNKENKAKRRKRVEKQVFEKLKKEEISYLRHAKRA